MKEANATGKLEAQLQWCSNHIGLMLEVDDNPALPATVRRMVLLTESNAQNETALVAIGRKAVHISAPQGFKGAIQTLSHNLAFDGQPRIHALKIKLLDGGTVMIGGRLGDIVAQASVETNGHSDPGMSPWSDVEVQDERPIAAFRVVSIMNARGYADGVQTIEPIYDARSQPAPPPATATAPVTMAALPLSSAVAVDDEANWCNMVKTGMIAILFVCLIILGLMIWRSRRH